MKKLLALLMLLMFGLAAAEDIPFSPVVMLKGNPTTGYAWQAAVEAEDLRGGGALTVAALGAEGETRLSGLHHIDRGYEHMVEKFISLGADIKRVDD